MNKDRKLTFGLGLVAVLSLGFTDTCSSRSDGQGKRQDHAPSTGNLNEPKKEAAEHAMALSRLELLGVLREVEQLWIELRRNPKARDRWAMDWNARVRAARSRLGKPATPGSPLCRWRVECSAIFYLNAALAEMQVYYRLGGDLELKRTINEGLNEVRKRLER